MTSLNGNSEAQSHRQFHALQCAHRQPCPNEKAYESDADGRSRRSRAPRNHGLVGEPVGYLP